MKITSKNNPIGFCDTCGTKGNDEHTFLCKDRECEKYHNRDGHCHDENNICMPFIEDCENHAESCNDSCHQECSCQNP